MSRSYVPLVKDCISKVLPAECTSEVVMIYPGSTAAVSGLPRTSRRTSSRLPNLTDWADLAAVPPNTPL